MEAMNTLQPVTASMMSSEDEPLHTAVPSNDEVWKINYYCHYHYYIKFSAFLTGFFIQN